MNLERLKRAKKEKKLTLQQIADESGIPKRTIDDIFSGQTKNPRSDTLEAIERALGIDSEENIWANKKRVGITADEEEMLDVFREIGEKFGAEAQARAVELVRVAFLKDSK